MLLRLGTAGLLDVWSYIPSWFISRDEDSGKHGRVER